MPNIKQKQFRIDENLAHRFEIKAKERKMTEIALITEYIELGLRKDSNQTTLD